MNRKNFFFTSIAISLFFLIFYLVCFVLTHRLQYDKLSYLFKTVENLNFHKNYSERLHHLRTSGFWGHNGKKETYLYTTVNEFSPNKINVLFQGDSWIEQLVAFTSNNSYERTYNLFNNFAQKNNFGLINAGTTSYSPSLMQVQYKVLEEDFGIKPDILVAYIDQSDIGDEICRYKDNRIYDDNNTLIAIKNENNTIASFDYTAVYNISKIKLLNQSQLKRNFKLTNFFFKYRIAAGIKKLKYIIKFGYKNRNVYKCRFDQIQKYLLNNDTSAISYFENRVKDYTNFLKNKPYIEKIILITFPHYGHTSGFETSEKERLYYSVNISDIVEDIVKKDKKIYHLNFTKLIADKKIKLEDNMFVPYDVGSHLRDEYLESIFLQEIISLFENDKL